MTYLLTFNFALFKTNLSFMKQNVFVFIFSQFLDSE